MKGIKMNKAEKFIKRIFEESLNTNLNTQRAVLDTYDAVYNKFKGKKIPPEYENALIKILTSSFI